MRNIEKEISEKLDRIEEKEGVRILHAVESGRALRPRTAITM